LVPMTSGHLPLSKYSPMGVKIDVLSPICARFGHDQLDIANGTSHGARNVVTTHHGPSASPRHPIPAENPPYPIPWFISYPRDRVYGKAPIGHDQLDIANGTSHGARNVVTTHHGPSASPRHPIPAENPPYPIPWFISYPRDRV